MIVYYRYFGVPIPPLSHEKRAMELSGNATIDQLMNDINSIVGDSSNELLKSTTFLVNKTGAKRDTVLNDEDEVIIMHLIGGG